MSLGDVVVLVMSSTTWGVLAEPAVAGHLEQVGTLSGVWHENPAQKVSGMRSDVFGEG